MAFSIKGLKKRKTQQQEQQVVQYPENTVQIANGAGTQPISVDWTEGMTVTTALQAAQIELKQGETAVIGETRISDPDNTQVSVGQMIVISNKPANG